MRRSAALLLLLALLPACGGDGKPAASPSAPAASSSGATPPPSADPPSTPATSAPPSKQGPPRLEKVALFQGAVHVTAPANDPRLFVVELPGRIRVIRDGKTAPEPFLDITDLVTVGGEQGLLSMAFAPDYAQSGRFYVDYTDTRGDVRIVEYRVSANPDKADEATRRELLKIEKPAANHNGGLVLFDPTGKLLIGIGDGGGAGDPDNDAQRLDSLLGKILRIDPLPSGGQPYGIPADNPFVGRAGARGEIWAYGLRNPWRFSFDPETRDLYLGDVGQNRVEEVNVVPPDRQAGANYGWRVYEGRSRFTRETPNDAARLVAPVHVYNHETGCAVTAGVVYRGSVAALRGQFLFGDYCSGDVWSFPAGTADSPRVTKLAFQGGHVSSFGVDAAGEVYVMSQDGEVWRITA
ncbi:MAG TPA: PQQ-dependent sugar dehydrogenase [Mycobacteriales bacterium]|jgi:glucose/arabinose dehydrogenase